MNERLDMINRLAHDLMSGHTGAILMAFLVAVSKRGYDVLQGRVPAPTWRGIFFYALIAIPLGLVACALLVAFDLPEGWAGAFGAGIGAMGPALYDKLAVTAAKIIDQQKG